MDEENRKAAGVSSVTPPEQQADANDTTETLESAGGAGVSPGGEEPGGEQAGMDAAEGAEAAGLEKPAEAAEANETTEAGAAAEAAGTTRRRGPVLFLGILSLLLLCALIVLLFRQQSTGGYVPSLTVQGDVERVLTLEYYGSQYRASSADQESPELLETETFVFEGSKHRGIPLTSILDRSGLYAEKCHIYLAGYDGMMSALDVSQLGENYVLFTANGWEIMNVDWPPSCNVKGMEWIAAVADRPDEVDASVTVSDDSGYERIVSPGTLLIMERRSALKFHGQSSNSGRDVSVFTTDTYTELGGTKLVLDGNRIVTE